MSDKAHNGQIDGAHDASVGGGEHGSPRDKRRIVLTQILQSPVLNPGGDELGRLGDLIVKLGEGGYPPVTGIKVRIGGRDVFVGTQDIEKIAPGEVRLKTHTLHTGAFQRRPGEVLLVADVLGRHLMDARHHRPRDVHHHLVHHRHRRHVMQEDYRLGVVGPPGHGWLGRAGWKPAG